MARDVSIKLSAGPRKGKERKGSRTAYLLLDVVERVGGVDGEADQDDMRVGIGQRAQTIVVLLASRIPKGQLDVLAIDLDVGDVVLEHGGDVDLSDFISLDKNN